LKATFDITIQHPLRAFARSNAAESVKILRKILFLKIIVFVFLKGITVYNQTFGSAQYISTVFKTTPKLSTHSIGWVILPDMSTYEQVMSNGVQVSLFFKRIRAYKKAFFYY
jgi:hypothetical protein